MADGDLITGTLPLDLIQPPIDFGVPAPSSLNVDPITGSANYLPQVPTYPDFTVAAPAGGSSGVVSTPPAPTVAAPVVAPAATPAATAAPAAAATAGAGAGNWLSTTAGNIGNWITNNPMSAIGALAGGGMLVNQMFGSGSDQEAQVMKQLGNQAGSAASTATMLQAPLTSGVLPPGAQAAVNQFQQGARAQEIGAYARMGMSGSTGEADALQAVNQRTQAMKFNIANDLFTQAAGYAKMASSDYAQLLQFQMQQDQDFSSALSKFVSALAGGAGTSKTSASATTIDPAALVQAEHAYTASNPLLTS